MHRSRLEGAAPPPFAADVCFDSHATTSTNAAAVEERVDSKREGSA